MPDPVRAAVEAHIAIVRKALRLDEADGRMTAAEAAEAMTAIVFSTNALRAALTAPPPRDERAEAAIALCEAQDRNTAAFDAWYRLIDDDPEKTDWLKVKPAKAALEDARVALAAARRRWVEGEGRT